MKGNETSEKKQIELNFAQQKTNLGASGQSGISARCHTGFGMPGPDPLTNTDTDTDLLSRMRI